MNTSIKTLLLTILFIVTGTFTTFAQQATNNNDTISMNVVKAKSEEFIHTILMGGAGTVKVKGVYDENCLYKIVVEANGNEYVSYMTKDGKKFFEAGRDIDVEMKKYNDEHIPIKSARPNVELFIMSYCPYGIQIEKGILPVLKTLGNKINFELKFCSYAMHDKKELEEQLREYCIQKQNPKLLENYLTCFLEDGNSKECLKKAAIDTVDMNKCIAFTDREYKVLEKYNDKNSWYNNKYPTFNIYREENIKYGLLGSPNLIINGNKMTSARDPESLMKLICSSFDTPPDECKLKLTSVYPAPGFGFNTTGTGPDFECNGNAK